MVTTLCETRLITATAAARSMATRQQFWRSTSIRELVGIVLCLFHFRHNTLFLSCFPCSFIAVELLCDAWGIPTRKTTVRTTPVRSQQCECQQCERVNSANANSANATAVRMSAVRMRQQCERRFSELCKTYRSLSFFFFFL